MLESGLALCGVTPRHANVVRFRSIGEPDKQQPLVLITDIDATYKSYKSLCTRGMHQIFVLFNEFTVAVSSFQQLTVDA